MLKGYIRTAMNFPATIELLVQKSTIKTLEKGVKMFKVNNKNTRTMALTFLTFTCSKSTIDTLEKSVIHDHS